MKKLIEYTKAYYENFDEVGDFEQITVFICLFLLFVFIITFIIVLIDVYPRFTIPLIIGIVLGILLKIVYTRGKKFAEKDEIRRLLK